MDRRPNNRAFTMVELMVVLGVITTLSALILPAIQSARGDGRRSSCQNNLRQINVALQNFETQRRHFPVGARCQRVWPSGLPTIGTSWWVEILPYLEQSALLDQLDIDGPYCGWAPMHPRNGHLIDGVSIGPVQCPASPFQPFGLASGIYRVEIPSYVGISGAADGNGFTDRRGRTANSNFGEFSSGGVLFANSYVRHRGITDGATNTLVVAEISDYCFEKKTGVPLTLDGSFQNGWLSGTIAIGTPREYSGQPAYNVTTIRYPVGTREYGLPGINSQGANNPLRSPHTGGAVGAYADGSVHFLSADTDLLTLKRLATRDDGEVVDR